MTDIKIATGRRVLAAIGLTGALLLGGCAYDDGYGYGGVSMGSGYYGGGGYYDGYGNSFYQQGAYGGWYDDFYYPGSGYYVYNRAGHRQRWNTGQQSYWEGRRSQAHGRDHAGQPQGNWNAPGRDDRGRREGGWRGRRNGNPAVTAPGAMQNTSPRPQWQGRQRPDGIPNGGQPGWRGNRDAGQPQFQRPQSSNPRSERSSQGERWRGRGGPQRNLAN